MGHVRHWQFLFALAWLTLTSPALMAAPRFPWARYARQPEKWFESDDARRIASNVLSYQSPLGSWPKNIDTSARPYTGDPQDLHGTFDNDATVGEMRFLARMDRINHDEHYRKAVVKGVDHILKAQYPTGGWPQLFPPGPKYHRYITFNDDATVNVLELLRDVTRQADFRFVPENDRTAAGKAFERGIACILKCQIIVKGERTAWCQQHDEKTLEPRGGRTFEPVAICGNESVGIVRLLMSLDKPRPHVVRAVTSACAYLEHVKIVGLRVTRRNGDRVVVRDPQAPLIWARYYEIGTNRPLFCGRDGVVKYDLSEIEFERRNGYGWLGYWPRDLLQKEYPAWKAKWVK